VGQPVILESQAALHVERPITGTWVAPGGELHQIHAYVMEIAIPTLTTGAPNAHPPLPCLDYVDNDQTPVPILKMPPPNP
jgi:hypothetical protein